MRAGRLLSILMLLQSRGRMCAQDLADELEVSARTNYRDVDHLSGSGVPITVERGAAGGFELLDGWRTRLTGFTPSEAQAVFMAGAPRAAAPLGPGGAAPPAQAELPPAMAPGGPGPAPGRAVPLPPRSPGRGPRTAAPA